MDDWRTIDTAPVNHFPLLVFTSDGDHRWAFRDVTWTWCGYGGVKLRRQPTHWMPLPPPPRVWEG